MSVLSTLTRKPKIIMFDFDNLTQRGLHLCYDDVTCVHGFRDHAYTIKKPKAVVYLPDRDPNDIGVWFSKTVHPNVDSCVHFSYKKESYLPACLGHGNYLNSLTSWCQNFIKNKKRLIAQKSLEEELLVKEITNLVLKFLMNCNDSGYCDVESIVNCAYKKCYICKTNLNDSSKIAGLEDYRILGKPLCYDCCYNLKVEHDIFKDVADHYLCTFLSFFVENGSTSSPNETNTAHDKFFIKNLKIQRKNGKIYKLSYRTGTTNVNK